MRVRVRVQVQDLPSSWDHELVTSLLVVMVVVRPGGRRRMKQDATAVPICVMLYFDRLQSIDVSQ